MFVNFILDLETIGCLEIKVSEYLVEKEREKFYELLISIFIYMYFLFLFIGFKVFIIEGGWRRGSDGFIWGKLNFMEWENLI